MTKFDYEAIRDTVVDPYGRKVVLALFKETHRPDHKFKWMWSLHKDWKPTFLKYYEPTEYDCAMALIGDWEHYQAIRNNSKIKPIIDKWVVEAEVALRSRAIKQMIQHSTQPNGAAAAKWLAEGSYMQKVLKNKKQEAEVEDALADRIADDAARIGLKVISGGK